MRRNGVDIFLISCFGNNSNLIPFDPPFHLEKLEPNVPLTRIFQLPRKKLQSVVSQGFRLNTWLSNSHKGEQFDRECILTVHILVDYKTLLIQQKEKMC